MPTYNLTWKPSDALLLEGLLLATGGEGGAPLQEVLLMVDALEGTTLTLKEVEEGLEKLISVQFIDLRKKKLSLTPGFLHNYEQTTLEAGKKAGAKPLEKLLQRQLIDEAKIVAVRESILKPYKVKSHYQQYLEQYG